MLGAGKLGEALVRGLIDSGAHASRRHRGHDRAPEPRARSGEQFGVRCRGAPTPKRRAGRRIVLLEVKPQPGGRRARSEIARRVTARQLWCRWPPSVSTAFIEKRLAGERAGGARDAQHAGAGRKRHDRRSRAAHHATPEHLETRARELFDAVGRSLVVDEKHLDAVTGLSASGPAFIYIVIESLAEAGVKVGLPRAIATELAAQTMLGPGEMVLETGEHPAQLKDKVTTPRGTTIDGILELEEGGLRVTLIKAVVRATRRARELLER